MAYTIEEMISECDSIEELRDVINFAEIRIQSLEIAAGVQSPKHIQPGLCKDCLADISVIGCDCPI